MKAACSKNHCHNSERRPNATDPPPGGPNLIRDLSELTLKYALVTQNHGGTTRAHLKKAFSWILHKMAGYPDRTGTDHCDVRSAGRRSLTAQRAVGRSVSASSRER